MVILSARYSIGPMPGFRLVYIDYFYLLTVYHQEHLAFNMPSLKEIARVRVRLY
jgi:hypothetical protein